MKRLPGSRGPAAILLLALVACLPSRADPGSPFESELARLAGRGARQCGLVSLRDDPKPGWQCALQADARGEPFWFALKRHGEDSEVWIAAIRAPDGAHIVLNSESRLHGGRRLEPLFRQEPCPGPIDYRPAEWPPLQCRAR